MNDNKALEKLIEEATMKERELQIRSEELAIQNKQFAEYLQAKKYADAELEVLWQMVKQYMQDNELSKYENDFIKLSLTPSGKYKANDIESVDDSLCDIKKILNNKKVKAFVELNGKLPEGVESTGYVLRKKLIENNGE